MTLAQTPTADRPVVVIGAGPIGLAAAAHLAAADLPFLVLEAGEAPAASVRTWGHVRLFSQWGELIDTAARKLLAPTGWVEPDPAGYPTGAEWAGDYLQPLADELGDRVRTGTRVTGISRKGLDRMSDRGRDTRPFVVRLDGPAGPERILASAIIDASGTHATPNPVGADGMPAIGEPEAADRLVFGAPDLSDPVVKAAHADKHTAVVGTGHTAMTALVALGALADEAPGTTVTWVLRRQPTSDTFGGGAADQLAARGALGLAAKRSVDSGVIAVQPGFRTAEIRRDGDQIALVDDDGVTVNAVDTVVVATGYRPDLDIESELRLDLDPSVQAPRALAPLIDPNVHSCGSVPPHGEAELAHPEAGLYVVGMKSYGRAPTFLALTGYEQVRSVVAMLAGDEEGAREVRLVLPETGVCGGSGLADDEAGLADDACAVPAGGLPLAGGGGCC